MMTTADEAVLAFVGTEGQSSEAVAARFPGFEVSRLLRARLLEISPGEPPDIEAHGHKVTPHFYVLTQRGAEALGLEEVPHHADPGVER